MLETYTPPNNASISFHTLPVSVRSEHQTLIMFLSAVTDHTFAKLFFTQIGHFSCFLVTSLRIPVIYHGDIFHVPPELKPFFFESRKILNSI